MKDYFKIGDVADLFRISVQTLRFYEREGLFVPEKIDRDSHYRYYSIHQLQLLQQIIFLRDLGLPLKTIRQQLEEPNAERYIRTLEALRDALVQRIADDTSRLNFLEGKIGTLKASAEGLQGASVSFETVPYETKGGLSTYIPGEHLAARLDRGETPQTPSYFDRCIDVEIVGATAGANADKAVASWDDNELSEWTNDGKLSTGWITYRLGRMATIDDICVKFTGWRMRSYPIEIWAGEELIWSGETPQSLGYVHLPVKPVTTREITLRLKGSATEQDAFSGIVEVVAPAAGELDLFKAKGAGEPNNELRIVEIEFKETLLQ